MICLKMLIPRLLPISFTFLLGTYIPRCNSSTKSAAMYFLIYAPKEDSNQTVHSCSLIRVFVVRMKKLCIHSYPNWSKGTDQTARMRKLN